jgi:hypothetical protein
MSTKDNWDDESSDEEGDAPPSPLLNGKISPLEVDCIQEEEYHEAQFVAEVPPPEDDENDEEYPEGGAWEDALQEDSDGGVGEDPPDDYYDELDDYDKKLGRYVAVR